MARLAPGVDPEAASVALNLGLAEANPDRATRLGQTRVVRTLYRERSATIGPAVLMLLAAVAAVLAMACANIVTVTLVRAEARVSEFALRRALGSGAATLARMACAETLILAAVGALGSYLVATLCVRLIADAELETFAALGELAFDGMVMAFGLLLTLTTAGLIGIAPVLGALGVKPQSVLRSSGSRGGATPAASRIRDALVVMQVSLTLALLVFTGLSASGFRSLVSTDPGFDEEGVLTVTIEMPSDRERVGDASAFYAGLLQRLSALPGVTSVGATNFLPLAGVGWSSSFDLVDPDPSMTDAEPHANMRSVTADYFEALGIPLVAGRVFVDADDAGAAPVAIVDESVARRYWPTGSPVGRQARILGLSREVATIVGVVADVPDERLGATAEGHVYFPLLQSPQRRVVLVLETAGRPGALAEPVRRTIREVDARMPITEMSTLEARVSETLAGRRIGLTLLILFGVAAVFLACVGAYGVLAYSVARRTREIGTRVALGAAPTAVLWSVLNHAMRLWTAGAVVGVAVCALGITWLSRYLNDIDVSRPWPYVGALVGLGLAAVASAAIPALRATRVDPAQAMRSE